MLVQEELKSKIDKIGIKYKKLSELSGIGKAYLTHIINLDRKLTPKMNNRLEPILSAFEETYERINNRRK